MLVQVVIEKDGTSTQARVVRHIHPKLDAKTLRIVRNMPRSISQLIRLSLTFSTNKTWYRHGTKEQQTKIDYSSPYTKKLSATLFKSHRGFIFISSVNLYLASYK